VQRKLLSLETNAASSLRWIAARRSTVHFLLNTLTLSAPSFLGLAKPQAAGKSASHYYFSKSCTQADALTWRVLQGLPDDAHSSALSTGFRDALAPALRARCRLARAGASGDDDDRITAVAGTILSVHHDESVATRRPRSGGSNPGGVPRLSNEEIASAAIRFVSLAFRRTYMALNTSGIVIHDRFSFCPIFSHPP